MGTHSASSKVCIVACMGPPVLRRHRSPFDIFSKRRLAHRHAVEMPIVEQTYRVLWEALPPRAAVHALLARTPKAETT